MNDSTPVKLLLIEDSPTDALLFRQHLEGVEDVLFEVHHCSSLRTGLEWLGRESYDAILLDLSLPDSVGLATFESVRDREPNTAIIILTGNDDRNFLNEALKKGADNYLLKDSADGNRIAVAVLSAIRSRSLGINSFAPPSRGPKNQHKDADKQS